MKVLLVEDDHLITLMIKTIVTNLGIKINCVSNVRDMYNSLIEDKYQLIILDNFFDGTQGILHAESIKKISGAKIILSSSEDIPSNQFVDQVIKKPLSKQILTKLTHE